jgi:hypothetical protein
MGRGRGLYRAGRWGSIELGFSPFQWDFAGYLYSPGTILDSSVESESCLPVKLGFTVLSTKDLYVKALAMETCEYYWGGVACHISVCTPSELAQT